MRAYSGVLGGLKITGNAVITFEYLGMEAGFQNKFFYNDGQVNNELFETRTLGGGAGTPLNTTQSFNYYDDGNGDFLSFSFWSGKTFIRDDTPNDSIFVENGDVDTGYHIAFAFDADIDPL